MTTKIEKDLLKKFIAVRPKYTQLELRAMGRKRTAARPITPLFARAKRKQEFWDFVELEKIKKDKDKTF